MSAADLVIKNHQGIKAEVEARADSFNACIAMGNELLAKSHYASDKVGSCPEAHGYGCSSLPENSWLKIGLDGSVIGFLKQGCVPPIPITSQLAIKD